MDFRVVTTVTTPAGSTDLVSLADVKLELGITGTADDAWLAKVISRASATVGNYCNRILAVQSYRDDIFLDQDRAAAWSTPGFSKELQLALWPLVGAVTVTEDGSLAPLVQGTDFVAEIETGLLFRLTTESAIGRWRLPLVATYQAGFAAIPADVQDAVLDMVKGRYYARSRDPNLRQESVDGVWSGSYWLGTGMGGEDDMSAYATGKLARYRVPVVA
jgi:hypothetical protein